MRNGDEAAAHDYSNDQDRPSAARGNSSHPRPQSSAREPCVRLHDCLRDCEDELLLKRCQRPRCSTTGQHQVVPRVQPGVDGAKCGALRCRSCRREIEHRPITQYSQNECHGKDERRPGARESQVAPAPPVHQEANLRRRLCRRVAARHRPPVPGSLALAPQWPQPARRGHRQSRKHRSCLGLRLVRSDPCF